MTIMNRMQPLAYLGGGIKGDGPPQTILQKKDKKRAKINVT